VLLIGSPLRKLNSYFVRGIEQDLLIAPAFRKAECLDALQEGLRQPGSQSERRDVLITHF